MATFHSDELPERDDNRFLDEPKWKPSREDKADHDRDYGD